jgi:hypothetical protein
LKICFFVNAIPSSKFSIIHSSFLKVKRKY